ncbi:MAG: PEP/pyruvate-binding domain-containing protein, partial [Candidatus ainarchaeum sp.]|nr:PEP/pyruvate-binding domain-containing protein [Candidatus ainarchaeum sp.]
MKFIEFFKDLNKDSVEIAGGKGASLGEMYSSGISVPNGFVVLSSAYNRFLEETDLNIEIESILKTVKIKDVSTIEKASEKIQALINLKEMPKDISKEIISSFKKLKTKHVAVRSSATSEDSKSAAWAGQLDTFLNTNEKRLIENVKRCFASLFTPRAIFYRFEKKLHNKNVSVAVVIQKMVDSEKSGIAFSVHPVTEDYNQMIIEAGYGLGEAIVSGQVTPDSYVVLKDKFEILDKNVNIQKKALYKCLRKGTKWEKLDQKVSESQVLSDKEIIDLSKIIKKIEDHYSFPCDIEWAIEKNKIYITQSRPITTLKNKIKIKKEKDVSENKIEFELEFTRETPIFMYDIWLFSYLNICENILKWNRKDINNTFGDYKNGVVKGYTIKNNIKLMKESFNLLDKLELDKLLDEYKFNYNKLLKNSKLVFNKKFVILLFSGFIINFILGDMKNNELCEKALKLRTNTDQLFPTVQNKLYNKVKNNNYRFLEIIENITKSNDILDKRNNCEIYENKICFNNIIKLEKTFTREHSIFYCSLWCDSNYKINKKYTGKNVENLVYLFYPNSDLISSYYNKKQLIEINKSIVNKYNSKKDYFEWIEKEFYKFWNKLLPYLKKEKKIKNIKELKKYYETAVNFYGPMAVTYVVPEIKEIPQKYKSKCLKIRKNTQYLVNDIGSVFVDFFENEFSNLKHLAYHILPEEVYLLENRNLTKKEIKTIENRKKNGSFLYNCKLYDLKDLNKVLKKDNIVIDSKIEQIKLTKLYTRERTLFFNYLEYMGNYKVSDKYIVDFSLDNFIYINKDNSNSYWYDFNSINKIYENIIDKYKSDKKYISNISRLHDKYWDKVKAYFKLEKNIKTLKELKEFLDNTWRFLNYMSVFYVSPNISGVDNKFKKISLEYREKTQNYINNVDIIFRNLINNKFKKYKEYVDYILPSEALILFKRAFTKKELYVIKNRKENGYIFYKGKAYPYNKLKTILKKDNLELPESEYKIQLHKEHSREYSLSRVYACNKMFTHYFKYIKAIGYPLKYNCLIYNGIDLVDSYYNQKELFTAFKYIEKQINEDYSKANDLMDNFEKIYFNLKEYLKHNKFITSVKEYKFVLENHSNYWTHVDFLLVFSDELYLKAPKKIKQRALKLREKTQEYNESLEPLFKNFIETKYPYLEGKYRFVLPDDIFNGDVKNKSLMLKKIKQREKGFVYYQGKLYTGDINKTLDKLNLALEKQETKVQEIKGQIGYKGKVKGKVRIITS